MSFGTHGFPSRRHLDCFFNSVFRLILNTSKLGITGFVRGELPLTNAWWRHQMETLSALLAICAGNSPVPGEFPAQRPVTRSFDALFDPGLNKQLSKQLWGWWFETLSCSLWRHCNGISFSEASNEESVSILWRFWTHMKASHFCEIQYWCTLLQSN